MRSLTDQTDKTEATDFSSLLENLPPIIAHAEIEHYLGGLISRHYLANLNSQGVGPKRFRFGRKVGYKREDLVEWLEKRSHIIRERTASKKGPGKSL